MTEIRGPYHIRDIEIKVPGGQIIKWTNASDVLKCFDFYFSDYETNLSTFPKIHDIPGGVLYGHSDESGLYNVPQYDMYNEAGYAGEIFKFWNEIVGKLRGTRGILLHSLNDSRMVNLFANFNRQDKFEIDWTYITGDKVAVIEVGYSEKTSAIPVIGTTDRLGKSKIHQLITKSLPQISRIASSILGKQAIEPYGIVCFPGHSCEIINEYLQSDAGALIQTFLSNQTTECLRRILFITQDTIHTSIFYRLTAPIGKHLLMQTCMKLADFFSCKLSENADRQYLHKTTAAYLSLSYLLASTKKKFSPIFAEAPYVNKNDSLAHAQELYLKKRKYKLIDQFGTDIILSPQQWRVLQLDQRLVIIDGKPGSGKTYLLVLKALEEARKQGEADSKESNVHLNEPCGSKSADNPVKKRIIFLLPFQKTFLLAELKQVFAGSIVELGFIEDIHLLEAQLETILLLIVDELEFNNGDTKIIRKLINFTDGGVTVWASWVNTGRSLLNVTDHISFYRIFTLHTMFRSATHISETVSYICDLWGDDKTAKESAHCSVFGSGQVSIPVSTFDDIQTLKLPEFTSRWRVAVFRNVEHLYKFAPLIESQTWELIDISPYMAPFDGKVTEYHFTGVEYDAVILIVDSFNGEDSQLPTVSYALWNSIISRAKFEVHVFLHNLDFIQKIKNFIPDFTNRAEQIIADARFEKNNRSVMNGIESLSLHHMTPSIITTSYPLSVLLYKLRYYNPKLLFDLRSSYQMNRGLVRQNIDPLRLHTEIDPLISFITHTSEEPITTKLETLDNRQIRMCVNMMNAYDGGRKSQIDLCVVFVCRYLEKFGLFDIRHLDRSHNRRISRADIGYSVPLNSEKFERLRFAMPRQERCALFLELAMLSYPFTIASPEFSSDSYELIENFAQLYSEGHKVGHKVFETWGQTTGDHVQKTLDRMTISVFGRMGKMRHLDFTSDSGYAEKALWYIDDYLECASWSSLPTVGQLKPDAPLEYLIVSETPDRLKEILIDMGCNNLKEHCGCQHFISLLLALRVCSAANRAIFYQSFQNYIASDPEMPILYDPFYFAILCSSNTEGAHHFIENGIEDLSQNMCAFASAIITEIIDLNTNLE